MATPWAKETASPEKACWQAPLVHIDGPARHGMLVGEDIPHTGPAGPLSIAFSPQAVRHADMLLGEDMYTYMTRRSNQLPVARGRLGMQTCFSAKACVQMTRRPAAAAAASTANSPRYRGGRCDPQPMLLDEDM